MEIVLSRKRRRAELKNSALKTNRSPSLKRTAKMGNAPTMKILDIFSDDFDDLFEMQHTNWCRPLGIFEFPWLKEAGGLAPELERYSLRDVFFSSLVDGCSATIGFPGDRLSRPKASPIILPAVADESMYSDGDAKEFESIWGRILRQPLPVVSCHKTAGA